MAIQYIYISTLINKHELIMPDFKVCDDSCKNFKIEYAQIKAKITYDSDNGPQIQDAEHDKKCLRLLEREIEHPNDVLLFPEYCISYDLLQLVVSTEELWPQENVLWCMPCQGIAIDKFLDTMQTCQEKGAVVIDNAYTNGFSKNRFVNALIYCFIAFDAAGERRIILAPQIKTYPMRDVSYQCESYLCTGSTIFLFGSPEGNGLLSLLCADSLNLNLKWEEIDKKFRGIILLHPQLNTNCKDSSFRRIRSNMFDRSNKHVYISCNWAKGTQLVGPDKKHETIRTPWSCIYYKYADTYKFEQWNMSNKIRLRINARKLLYGSFLKQSKVAIWYTIPEEVIHELTVQKPYSSQVGIVTSEEYVVADWTGIWIVDSWIQLNVLQESEYRENHYCLYLNNEYCEALKEIILCEDYKYPFSCIDKNDADTFFEQTFVQEAFSFSEIDGEENILSPTLIIDDNTLINAEVAVFNLAELVMQLKQGNFPKHLYSYKDKHKFGLITDKDGVSYNLLNKDEKNQIIVGIAQDATRAKRYINYMKKGALLKYSKDNDNDFPYKMCIFAKRIGTSGYDHFPAFNPSIVSPERAEEYFDLTQGGSENE